MEITRDVILDLLPLYVADEVSADTRALVEEYLESDPELANVAKRLEALELSGDVPVPLTAEDQVETYREAKRLMRRRNIVWGGVIAFAILTLLGVGWLTIYTFTTSSP
jgi:anti-sigma factor RsiW